MKYILTFHLFANCVKLVWKKNPKTPKETKNCQKTRNDGKRYHSIHRWIVSCLLHIFSLFETFFQFFLRFLVIYRYRYCESVSPNICSYKVYNTLNVVYFAIYVIMILWIEAIQILLPIYYSLYYYTLDVLICLHSFVSFRYFELLFFLLLSFFIFHILPLNFVPIDCFNASYIYTFEWLEFHLLSA